MVYAVLIALLLTVSSLGAQQVPNGSFEEWITTEGSGQYKTYEEPAGGWSSGNGAIHIAAGSNPVCEKTTDAHSGSYAAKLVTQKIFGQVASGSLFTGTFQLNLANPAESARRGIPFTEKPTAFTAWYKYAPQQNDSATLYAILSRWDGSKRVAIAEARKKEFSEVQEWTKLTVPFVYYSGEQPDTIAVVFAASAGGEFFKGAEGSTLYVDDVVLVYGSSVQAGDSRTGHTIGDIEEFRNRLGTFSEVVVFDVRGRQVTLVRNTKSIIPDELHPGAYIVQVNSERGLVCRQKILVH
ncbi:MAG: hypothetical protein D8M52_00145 [Chlorobi bacterium]|nr:MAG: hypothetical protein F9K28_08065 [Bacteroidota bacterium]KXK34283.1 MAG: putative glycoside hydrolase [Chlorobi bacterium OLB6]MBE2265859.1 PCMD domain-containing protein [Flavobacteriales bacterium]MBL1160113.1 hypothetical protein [Chlorobiota bacterium]MBW7854209.1 PCMD domain-containing protein [Candidatus Kapabacteria bacterium]MCC6330577.1 PCMD domain-containing protein [Ignavibacteria bacterium]